MPLFTTVADVELMAYRRLGYADTPTNDVVVRMRQWIAVWQFRILSRAGIELLSEATITFSSVVNQAQYVLPGTVRRINKIYELNSPTALRMDSLNWIRETDPGAQASGLPEMWAPVKWGSGIVMTIQLWPTPSSVITYNVDCRTTIDVVSDPSNPLLIPQEFGWLLVEAACYEEWLRKADTRAGTARQDLETGIKEMRHWLYSPPDYQPSNAQEADQPSRLGGMYPSWRSYRR